MKNFLNRNFICLGEVMETEAKSGDKDDEKNEQKQDTEDEGETSFLHDNSV